MNILIIGGAGFVGVNLVRHCLSEGEHNVTVLDSLDPHFGSDCAHLAEVWRRIHFIRGSMTDENLLAEVVQGQDFIFNLAGQSSHTLSVENPLLDAEINCVGHLKVLEAIRFFNPKATVVYASSSTVIGRASEEVIDESHPERPLEIYSANKGVAEKYYRIYHKIHGLKTIILRFSNLYGPYGKANPDFGFINYFISQALEDKSISVYGEGNQTRNVMFVGDAVDVLWKVRQESSLYGEICFATSPYHYTVRQIAEAIHEVFMQGEVVRVDWPEVRKKMDVERVMFSSEKLRAVTGWQARYDLMEGLRETKRIVAEAEENPVNIPNLS